MKTKNISIWAITALAASLLAAPVAYSQTERFSANLVGANVVPSINTGGSGEFRMQIVGSDINFSLSFFDLSSNLTVAHLHFAASKVAGGVMIFLCGGGGQPDCPAVTSGNITGTITAANVTGPTTQGIDVGDLDSALEAVRAGLAYANMHTVNFAGGEIRGQVHRGTVETAIESVLAPLAQGSNDKFLQSATRDRLNRLHCGASSPSCARVGCSGVQPRQLL